MKRHAIFVFLLVTYVFWNNFFMMLETGENAFGGVRYYVDKDSACLNNLFYDFLSKKYDELLRTGKIDDKNKNYLRPSRIKEKGSCFLWIKDCKLDLSVCVSDNEVYIICASYRKEEYRNPLCKFLNSGCHEHDFVVWMSFEKEVLDKLGIEYKKDWPHLYRNWYARWFFKNQLYIIALFVSSYILYCCIEKFNKWRRFYVNQKRE